MSNYLSTKFNKNNKSKGYGLAVSLLVYHTFISTSLILSIIGISNILLVLTNIIGILILILFYSRKINIYAIIFILIIFFFTGFKVINFNEISFFKINLFLLTSVLLVSVSKYSEIKSFIDISSQIIIIILIGTIIGFIVHQIGIKPLYSFIAQNERLQVFYYTSFGHSLGTTLRPSGIYDEPGTLAFMIGGLLVLRQIFSLNQMRSLTILFLGFITFSLAFLVFSIFYVAALNLNKGQRSGIILIFMFFLFLIYITNFNTALEDNLFSRFTLSQDARQGLRGGRETLLWNAIDNLSLTDNSLLWGVNPYCTINNEECLKKGYMGENPLTPIAYHGIFIAWPYYLFIIISLLISLKGRKYLFYLALMSLFLQRPYLLNYGVSLLGILPLYSHYILKIRPN